MYLNKVRLAIWDAQAEQAIHGTKFGPSMAQVCLSHPYPDL